MPKLLLPKKKMPFDLGTDIGIGTLAPARHSHLNFGMAFPLKCQFHAIIRSVIPGRANLIQKTSSSLCIQKQGANHAVAPPKKTLICLSSSALGQCPMSICRLLLPFFRPLFALTVPPLHKYIPFQILHGTFAFQKKIASS